MGRGSAAGPQGTGHHLPCVRVRPIVLHKARSAARLGDAGAERRACNRKQPDMRLSQHIDQIARDTIDPHTRRALLAIAPLAEGQEAAFDAIAAVMLDQRRDELADAIGGNVVRLQFPRPRGDAA